MPSRSRRRRPAPAIRLAALGVLFASAAVVTFLVACPPGPRAAAPATTAPAPTSPALEPAEGGAPSAAQPTHPAPSPAASKPAPQAAPAAPQPAAQSAAQASPLHPQPELGLLAVVIDDAGYSLSELQAFLDVPGPLTVAVLPNLPYSTEAARRVTAAGKDLILHAPMEPSGGQDPGPGAILTGQTAAEQRALLAAAFATVPGAIGMNNHMGSKATADAATMTAVLGYLRQNHLLFLDSRTTPDTVGPRLAQSLGVPSLQRDVFMDVDTAPSEEAAAFDKGVAEARRRGTAVVIGHVQNPSVAAILRDRVRSLAAEGVRLARLAEVIERQGEAASP